VSAHVNGVIVFRHIPPANEAGTNVHDICDATGLPRRNVERILAAFEAAGLAKREPGRRGCEPWGYPARWWRA
jgi:DNA-binding IclR family transcriptional regulator